MTGADRPGAWLDRGDTVIYDSDWVRLVTSDVVMPDGTQIDHHVVRMPRPAAGAVMVHDGHMLLLHRHRFITDSWGWEIPAGGVDPGETPEEAAIREACEESGWQPQRLRRLCQFHPANGLLDQTFHIFTSHDAVELGAPTDPNEADRIEWVPLPEVKRLLADGAITDGLTFGAVSFAFATDAI